MPEWFTPTGCGLCHKVDEEFERFVEMWHVMEGEWQQEEEASRRP